MLIKLSQLRKIIREELSRTLSEDASDLSAAEPSEMVKNLAGKTGLGPFSYGPISLRNLMAKVESTGDISLLDNWDKVVAAAYETEKEIKRIRNTPTYEITDAQGNKQVRPRSPGSILNTESRKAAEDAAAEQGLEGEVAGRDYAAYVSTLVDSMKNFKQVPPIRADILAALEFRKQKKEAHENREASPEDIKKLRNLLASHDWYYERAEGLQPSYTKGAAQAEEIKLLVNKMGKTGRDMYNAAAAKAFPKGAT